MDNNEYYETHDKIPDPQDSSSWISYNISPNLVL